MKPACVHVRVGMECPAREVPTPPSARGVWLTSGRLTRSERRHGDTESGFEVGLRAILFTWCLLGRGFSTTEHTETPFGRHGRRSGKNVFRTIWPLFAIQIIDTAINQVDSPQCENKLRFVREHQSSEFINPFYCRSNRQDVIEMCVSQL